MEMMKSEYDLSSAVTFLLIGLGLGSVFTILFGPSTEPGRRPEGINRWRQGEAKGRLRHRSRRSERGRLREVFDKAE
jgi:hypothetical protein